MDLLSLGMKIKAERKRQGLTLEALSEKLGISRNFLWEIEAGRKAPALNTLYNLGVTLDISIDYLMGVSTVKKSITDEAASTAHELEVIKIVRTINALELKELRLISSLIDSFSEYFEQK